MSKKFKHKTLTHLVMLVTVILLINSCTKKDDEDLSPAEPWGEFITIPGISEGVAGDNASELKSSNEGLYMRIDKASTANPWIYRLQNGGPSPDWYFHEEPDLYFDWEPAIENTENPGDFSIFFTTITKNGYVNINTGLPALQEENNPAGWSPLNEMLVDNSFLAKKWAFFGSDLRLQDNTNLGLYTSICSIPNQGGILFAEADPYDAVIWAASSNVLYKITASGTITSFDVSSFDDPSMLFHTIEKIRFPYDPLHKDVYFRYQNKVFKIEDGTSGTLFYTIDHGANFLGGDFCVDRTYMYATDGTKKHQQLLTETNIIPPQPNTSDQALLLDYVYQTSAFGTGPIEVSKDPLDQYIYAIYNVRLLKVPKSL